MGTLVYDTHALPVTGAALPPRGMPATTTKNNDTVRLVPEDIKTARAVPVSQGPAPAFAPSTNSPLVVPPTLVPTAYLQRHDASKPTFATPQQAGALRAAHQQSNQPSSWVGAWLASWL